MTAVYKWILVFVILSGLFCAFVWYDGYRQQDKTEQAPITGYVKNVLDENGRPILKYDPIEAWKDENEWLFGDKYDRRIEEGLISGTVSFTSKKEYDKTKAYLARLIQEAWIKSNSIADSFYMPERTTREAIQELKESQLALKRRYDSLNKKFEQWKNSEISRSVKGDTLWIMPKQWKTGGKIEDKTRNSTDYDIKRLLWFDAGNLHLAYVINGDTLEVPYADIDWNSLMRHGGMDDINKALIKQLKKAGVK